MRNLEPYHEFSVKIVFQRYDHWRKDVTLQEKEMMRVLEEDKALAEAYYERLIKIGESAKEEEQLLELKLIDGKVVCNECGKELMEVKITRAYSRWICLNDRCGLWRINQNER